MDPFASATELLADLRAAKFAASDLTELYIRRIEMYDTKLNAVVVRDFARARQAARAADKGDAGALHGLPMTLKESINVAGLGTTCGVPDWKTFVSEHDAPAWSRLRAAGAVLMGKTNVPPMLADWQSSNPIHGRTNNPWDLARTPGGSSGGSAAALAAGLTALEVGSDIGGSIRVPAAFCGVYGHRPSETLLPRSGQFPIPPLPNAAVVMGVQGPLARSAEDLELALSVLAGAERRRGRRVAGRASRGAALTPRGFPRGRVAGDPVGPGGRSDRGRARIAGVAPERARRHRQARATGRHGGLARAPPALPLAARGGDGRPP